MDPDELEAILKPNGTFRPTRVRFKDGRIIDVRKRFTTLVLVDTFVVGVHEPGSTSEYPDHVEWLALDTIESAEPLLD